MSAAKTAEPIEMPFGFGVSYRGAKKRIIRSPESRPTNGHFWEHTRGRARGTQRYSQGAASGDAISRCR